MTTSRAEPDASPLSLPGPLHLSPVSFLLHRSFGRLTIVYLYLLILLPSGSIFGVNVKMICFLLLLPVALQRYLQNARSRLLRASFLLAVPSALYVWVLLSQVYEYDIHIALYQYREFIITFASSWLCAVYCDHPAARVRFLRGVLFAETAASLLKVALLAYAYHKGVSVAIMVDDIGNYFGTQLMGMDFETLGRIQFISDGLIPVAIFVLLRYRKKLKLSLAFSIVSLTLLAASLIFTFSRYLWVFAAIAFCLGLLFGPTDRVRTYVSALFVAIVLVELPVLTDLYVLRFSDAIAGGSDIVRAQQVPPLERFIKDAPIMGHGLGTYTYEIVRSHELPYGYEVQIYALAGQVGLVGISLLLLLTFCYFRSLWPRTMAAAPEKLILCLLLTVWLLAGLFNPMLFNSAAAVSYASFRALGQLGDAHSI